MNVQDWGAIGEVISAIAVVISLFYLAIQLRTNTRTLRANAAWDSEVTYGNHNVGIARDPAYALLLNRASAAHARPEDFTESETAQLYFGVRSALQLAQAQWWLWRNGNLPNELWEYRRRWARLFVEAPVLKPIWEAEREQNIFAEEFVQDILSAEHRGELSVSPREA